MILMGLGHRRPHALFPCETAKPRLVRYRNRSSPPNMITALTLIRVSCRPYTTHDLCVNPPSPVLGVVAAARCGRMRCSVQRRSISSMHSGLWGRRYGSG